MTERDFCYWLQGFVELTQGQTPNPAQWKSIQEHLGEVFKKVTPPVGMEQKITVPADTDVSEILRKYLETQKNVPFDWSRTIVTC